MTDWHLSVIHRDEHYIAVNKPAGMLVHRTAMAKERDVALQRVRDQIGRRIYPVHRLDRPTAGVLIFALSPEAAEALAGQFRERTVVKHYLAVCRGWLETAGTIDRDLKDKGTGELTSAFTEYQRLDTVELPIPVSRYPAARYSLAWVTPRTGRRHQIRRHFASIAHPLVGDTTHGQGEHNRLFRNHFNVHSLLLCARRLAFIHPYEDRWLTIEAEPNDDFRTVAQACGWSLNDLPA